MPQYQPLVVTPENDILVWAEPIIARTLQIAELHRLEAIRVNEAAKRLEEKNREREEEEERKKKEAKQ